MFKVEKGKDGTCYQYGKPGHFQYECTSNGRNSGEAREKEDSSKREEARVLNSNNETGAAPAEATAATTAEAGVSEAEAVNRGEIGLNLFN